VPATIRRLVEYVLVAKDEAAGSFALKDSPEILGVTDVSEATPQLVALGQLTRHSSRGRHKCRTCSAADVILVLLRHVTEQGGSGMGGGPYVEFVEQAQSARRALYYLLAANYDLYRAGEMSLKLTMGFGPDRVPSYAALWEGRLVVNALIDQLLSKLAHLQMEVQRKLESPDLREVLNAKSEKRKPRNALLDEITLILNKGGFGATRIGKLVDDGGAEKGAAGRAQERLSKIHRKPRGGSRARQKQSDGPS
jgi:hypothetical protein